MASTGDFERIRKNSSPPPEPYIIGDRGPEIVAGTLAEELGSDSTVKARGKTDMRRFSVIDEQDIPLLVYAKIRGQKTRGWKMLYDEILNLRVSVGGRGRRDVIRMEGVSRSGMMPTSMESELIKPGWFQRNITNRRWRKKAQEEML